MRATYLVFGILVLAVAAIGEEEQDRAKKIAALEKQNLLLKRRVAELESQLDELFAIKVTEKHTVRHSMPFDGERLPAHLKGIDLPETASKYQVREYVAKILRAAVRHRGGYGAADPEVGLLKLVGSAHVDVLLEPLLYSDVPNADIYLIEALKTLVGQQHQQLVLKTLPLVRDLVQVVVLRGWTKHAAPTLLNALADRDSWTLPNPGLPTEWIEAVAKLERPESYEDLKTFFYYGTNRYHTWKAIRHLPGIDLKAQVDGLWKWAKGLDDAWQRISVAAVAAHCGHLDALELLFEDPRGWPEWEVIEAVTPYRGERNNAEHAKQWFKTHKSRLKFDAAQGKYNVLPEGKQND